MSFEPELAVCPECHRRGCWSEEAIIEHTPVNGAPILFKQWTCKCGFAESEEISEKPDAATPVIHTYFVGGMGRP